jgi:hypothetical protein
MFEKEIDICTVLIAIVPDCNTAVWKHLLWEQRAGGSNPSAPTIIFQLFTGAKVGSAIDHLHVAQML